MQFDKHFAKNLSIMSKAFGEVEGATSSLRFPFVVLEELITSHDISKGLHGLALCLSVPQAKSRLNRLQADWGSAVLGFAGYPHGTWCNVVAECGWTRLLGTQLLAEAVMLEARILMMPMEMQVNQILLVAVSSDAPSWAQQVVQLRARLEGIPDIMT